MFLISCNILIHLLNKLVEGSSLNPNIDSVYKDLNNLASKYEYLLKSNKKIKNNSPIWVMWYQGIENAPPIIKVCVASIYKNKAKHRLILLDKNNLYNYITLPDYIMDKFNRNVFSITHFSDIVRFALLYKYGGYWIDSSYLVTAPLMHLNTSYFTLKVIHCFSSTHISKCRWAVNFFATPKNDFLATYGYNAIIEYWKKYDSLIEYFLIDIIFFVAFNKEEKIRNLTNNLPYINCNIFSLANKLNNNFNKCDIECPFNKLSRGLRGKIYNKGIMTNFGYLAKEYKLNMINFSQKKDDIFLNDYIYFLIFIFFCVIKLHRKYNRKKVRKK